MGGRGLCILLVYFGGALLMFTFCKFSCFTHTKMAYVLDARRRNIFENESNLNQDVKVDEYPKRWNKT